MDFNFIVKHFTVVIIKSMKPVLSILFLFISLSSYSQISPNQHNDGVIQLTGAIVETDSLKPMPFVHITVKNSRIGTISDFYGFFSFVAHKGDTIMFSSVGYHRNEFIIPDTLSKLNYSIIHLMTKDTFILDEVTIYPWPTREQFKQAFMALKLPDDDIERAKKNLDPKVMMAIAENIPIDGSTTYKYQLQNRYTQLYEAGGYPSIRLLDPIAWSKFIKAWQDGDFKKKENINYLPR
jgi:CarboxypepD_reg-like domain